MTEKSFETILLVEDDEIEILIAKKILSQAGYQIPIHAVCNGKQAIDFLLTHWVTAEKKDCSVLVRPEHAHHEWL